uniref:homeobox-leucine zipper protein HDG11-like n=1 Tax=Erigeron canadensis TaxID=72917 RepID=UPI001CB969D2|nr:homeobox-leucine zipper protein HDG11-like [Erigeron canadensis]
MEKIQISLQATTPIVPGRTFVILRTCKKIDELTWVTWVEHLELEQSYLDPKLYNDLCCRGFAFGAERWVACLARSCERRSYHRSMSELALTHLKGQDLLDFEKRCVMMISKRMVRDFCLNIVPLCRQPDPTLCVPPPSLAFCYLKRQKSPNQDNPNEYVVFATTTFSVPHSPEFVLRILGDESRRHELDASGRIGRLADQVTCYTTGDDPMNKISVQANQSLGNNEVLLQETSVSPSGSLVVWSLLTKEPFELPRLGRVPQDFPLIGLSGVANSLQNTTTSSNTGGGSFITLGLQQVYCYTDLGPKLTEVVTKLMRDTINRIVAVLNSRKDQGM